MLGRRTGHERPRYDPYSPSDANGKPVRDNIVTLPRGEPPRMPDELDEETFAKRLKQVAPEGSDIAAKLQAIAKADRSFDPMHFMKGAKAAYEMIVTAYAEGDRKTLKQLLSRDVFDSFAEAITDRERNGYTVEFKFVGITNTEIIDADVNGKVATVTVKFVSDVITATRNRGGRRDRRQPDPDHRRHRRLDVLPRYRFTRSELEGGRDRLGDLGQTCHSLRNKSKSPRKRGSAFLGAYKLTTPGLSRELVQARRQALFTSPGGRGRRSIAG